jgi:hypothetical protein
MCKDGYTGKPFQQHLHQFFDLHHTWIVECMHFQTFDPQIFRRILPAFRVPEQLFLSKRAVRSRNGTM